MYERFGNRRQDLGKIADVIRTKTPLWICLTIFNYRQFGGFCQKHCLKGSWNEKQ